MSEHTWVADEEMEAVLLLLGRAVVGLPDEITGEPIDDAGIGCNCAARYANEVFALRDYCWCEGSVHPEIVPEDDDAWDAAIETAGGTSTGCPVNFEYKPTGLQAVWYKHMGRDVIFNRSVTHAEAVTVLRECLVAIDAHATALAAS